MLFHEEGDPMEPDYFTTHNDIIEEKILNGLHTHWFRHYSGGSKMRARNYHVGSSRLGKAFKPYNTPPLRSMPS